MGSGIVQALSDILSLIGQYTYLAVFLGVMLESAGVPLPGETVLIASGALAHEGILDPGEALLFGIPPSGGAGSRRAPAPGLPQGDANREERRPARRR
jgi:hypothetical protein